MADIIKPGKEELPSKELLQENIGIPSQESPVGNKAQEKAEVQIKNPKNEGIIIPGESDEEKAKSIRESITGKNSLSAAPELPPKEAELEKKAIEWAQKNSSNDPEKVQQMAQKVRNNFEAVKALAIESSEKFNEKEN